MCLQLLGCLPQAAAEIYVTNFIATVQGEKEYTLAVKIIHPMRAAQKVSLLDSLEVSTELIELIGEIRYAEPQEHNT